MGLGSLFLLLSPFFTYWYLTLILDCVLILLLGVFLLLLLLRLRALISLVLRLRLLAPILNLIVWLSLILHVGILIISRILAMLVLSLCAVIVLQLLHGLSRIFVNQLLYFCIYSWNILKFIWGWLHLEIQVCDSFRYQRLFRSSHVLCWWLDDSASLWRIKLLTFFLWLLFTFLALFLIRYSAFLVVELIDNDQTFGAFSHDFVKFLRLFLVCLFHTTWDPLVSL